MNFILTEINTELNNDIDSITEGRDLYIKVSNSTPDILLKAGLSNKPICFPRQKILTGLLSDDFEKHGHKNEIGKKTLKKSLPHIGDPLAITYTEEDSFGVYLEDRASTGKPLYVYIRYDNKRDINVILSIYGRVATDNEKFIYIDDTRIRRKWDTSDYIVKKFKYRLEDEVFRNKVLTKTKLKGVSV